MDYSLQAPCLLVSSPELMDPNFKKSVVLLCKHSDDGTLGFIVNHPLGIELGRMLEDPIGFERLLQDPVYLGGPVQVNVGTILYAADKQQEDSIEVGKGLYMTSSLDVLKKLHEGDAQPFYRFLLGYAGWAAGQLEWEIRQHSWLISELDMNSIKSIPASELWDRIMDQMGINANNLITPESSMVN